MGSTAVRIPQPAVSAPGRPGRASASPQEVGGIAEDSKGVLWLASGTLQRFDPAAGRFTAYTLNLSGTGKADTEGSSTLVRSGTKRVNSYLTIDHSGVIWAATGNGLLRFDPQREQFTTYYESDGLPSNSVNAILEDHNGNLWVSTAGGLSRFNPRAKTFTNYDEADGLTSDNFEGFPVACQSRRGQMFFGNSRGLTSFWPDQIVEKPFDPARGPDRIFVAEPAGGARPGLAARKLHHVYALVDTVSRAEHVLVRVRRSELPGSATEPVSVHAGGTRPFLDPGGL